MRGTSDWQVHEIFKEVDCTDQSKHDDKEAARSDGAKTWHDIGKEIGVYSYNTADQYRDVWENCLNETREDFGVKDIEKLTAEHVQSFLEGKIDQGVAYSTFQAYAAALEKLETALSRYSESHDRGNQYNFSEAIKETRQEAQQTLTRDQAPRAYENPQAIISQIENSTHQLAAQIQYEGGPRVSEVSLIRDYQLKGEGTVSVIGKGGKEYDIKVSNETYGKLEAHIKENGAFKIDQNKYRADIKQAAEKSGQEYNQSHGLRWNFCQEKVTDIQEKGGTYLEALKEASEAMGHERCDITEHYLR